MRSLETKVPPPVVALVITLAMWGLSRLPPVVHNVPATGRLVLAIALAAAGAAVSAAGVLAFRSARTTVNPLRPDAASALVVGGVYRITRNPMYLGLLLLLLAWATFLWSPWLLLGPVAFVAYIGRFQIAPEERALDTLFGAEFARYKARVRRWI